MKSLLMYVVAALITTGTNASITPASFNKNPNRNKKPQVELNVTKDIDIITAGGVVTLRSGTSVVVEALQNYNSKNLSDGQVVNVRVKYNVVVNKQTVIAAGSIGNATVINVQKPGSFGKPGKVELQIQSVQSVDGQQILLSGMNMIAEGQNKRGLAWGLSIGLFIFTIIGGAAGFFIKGKPAEIKSGTTSNASVASDAQIEIEEK